MRKLIGLALLIFSAVLVLGQTRTGGGINLAPLSKVQSCGTTSACAGTGLNSPQVVWGTAPLVTGTPSTVTVSGISPAFTSNASYKCLVQDQTAAANNSAISVSSYVSGSSFTITGPTTNTDVILYVCTGN